MRIVLCAICLVAGVSFAQTPIHQCKDADGGIVYSQLPCKDEQPASDPETVDEADTSASQEAPLIPTEFAPSDDEKSEPASDDDTAACKQRYRDAIDEIDAEIRLEYTPEKDAEYKQRLLTLTRKLRAC